jgi:hypothetical protein
VTVHVLQNPAHLGRLIPDHGLMEHLASLDSPLQGTVHSILLVSPTVLHYLPVVDRLLVHSFPDDREPIHMLLWNILVCYYSCCFETIMLF